MEALILTLFISLILVALGVGLLVKRIRAGDMDHGDRLSLLPLEEEGTEPRNDASCHTDRGDTHDAVE